MQLETAIEIAARAHRGQVDKAGQPYILHPVRLMLAAASHDERVVAVLHDVVEDSDWTMAQLREAGLTSQQETALDGVTRREDETYAQFIERAAADPVARAVKILDLEDNSNLARISDPQPSDHERVRKYEQALIVLRSWRG